MKSSGVYNNFLLTLTTKTMNAKLEKLLDFVDSLERTSLSEEQQIVLLGGENGNEAAITYTNNQCNTCPNPPGGTNFQCNGCSIG